MSFFPKTGIKECADIMRVEVTVPKKMMPKVDPVNPCPCQFKPVRLEYNKMQVFWNADEGDEVKEGENICTGEVDKKTLEITSPCNGILTEILVDEGESAGAGDILAYIDSEISK